MMARHQQLRLACCVLFLVVVIAPCLAFALSCQSVAAGGDWHHNSTWTGCGGGLPGPDDVATIGGSLQQQADVSIASGSVVQVAAVLVNSGRLLNKGPFTSHKGGRRTKQGGGKKVSKLSGTFA